MKKISVLTVAIMMMLGTMAMANTTQNVIFDFEIPYMFDLQWAVGMDGSFIDLTGVNAITPVEIADGLKTGIPGGVLLSTANADYNISVLADGDFFDGGDGSKPVSDLLVSRNGSEYLSMNAVNPVYLMVSTPSFEKVNTLDYALQLNPDDSVGIYSMMLTYTLAACP